MQIFGDKPVQELTVSTCSCFSHKGALNHPIRICNIVTAANTSRHTELNYKLGRTVTVQKNLTLGNSPRMMTEPGCEEHRAVVNIGLVTLLLVRREI